MSPDTDDVLAVLVGDIHASKAARQLLIQRHLIRLGFTVTGCNLAHLRGVHTLTVYVTTYVAATRLLHYLQHTPIAGQPPTLVHTYTRGDHHVTHAQWDNTTSTLTQPGR